MKYTTTNTACMEGDTADTGPSMPPTISIPTTSPIRQEDCNLGTKESSNSDLKEICHNNSHCYSAPYEPLDENSGHNQGTHQNTSKGIIPEGIGGPYSCRKVYTPRSDSVLDSAITSSGIPPKSQPKQQKAQKSPDNPKELQPRTEVRSRRNPQLSHQPSYLR